MKRMDARIFLNVIFGHGMSIKDLAETISAVVGGKRGILIGIGPGQTVRRANYSRVHG